MPMDVTRWENKSVVPISPKKILYKITNNHHIRICIPNALCLSHSINGAAFGDSCTAIFLVYHGAVVVIRCQVGLLGNFISKGKRFWFATAYEYYHRSYRAVL